MRSVLAALAVTLWSVAAQAQEPPPPGAPPPPPPPAPEGPSAGGLTAPPPIDTTADSRGETERDLDEAEEEDSGRGLTWFYVNAQGGFQHVGLETFAVDESNLTAGLATTEASGGFYGVGLGAQLLFLRIGPRFRHGFFPDWQMFSIGGELGIRIPIKFMDLHFDLGGGYVALGSLGGALASQSDAIDVNGGYGRIGGGLDFFIGEIFSVGPFVSWEFMGLTRPGVDPTEVPDECESDPDAARECALAREGSGFGSAITVGGMLGLNF